MLHPPQKSSKTPQVTVISRTGTTFPSIDLTSRCGIGSTFTIGSTSTGSLIKRKQPAESIQQDQTPLDLSFALRHAPLVKRNRNAFSVRQRGEAGTPKLRRRLSAGAFNFASSTVCLQIR